MENSHSINGVDDSHRHLPIPYYTFLTIWLISACSWTFNTFKYRHFQANGLQWTLALVPFIKALQLILSFLFWDSCYYHQICSIWMSFGVYVTNVVFQTISFVCFLLISFGYCITCESLSLPERRTIALLSSFFYFTLVGYRTSLPYFSVLMILNYMISFYVIFNHIWQNISVLREQLSFVEDDNIQAMRDAVYAKYIMLKKFQGAMKIVAMAETVIYLNMANSSHNYWLRLLIRECAQFCIFLYIGSRDMAPRFSIMSTLKAKENSIIPPVYSMDMDAKSFKDLKSNEWNIGVPKSYSNYEKPKDSVLVIIQHPR